MPRIFFLCLLAVITLGSCASSPRREPADLVLRNGKVLTMEPDRPQVEAVAVKGQRILAVGSDAELEGVIGPQTEVLDLSGALAVPGLIEGHGHFMSLGESLMELDLRGAGTWEDIVELVAEAVREAEPGQWIVGRGWHQDKWRQPPTPSVEGLPTHHGLSAVSPHNPVMLIHVSGHGVFVNGQALKLVGYSRETPDPPGGRIVRDGKGEPTGMLREAAQDPVREALARYQARRSPEEIQQELRRQAELAAAETISKGITSFHDMGETFETIDFLKRLSEEGQLPLRLYVAIQEPAERLEGRLAGYRMVGHGDNHLTVRAIGEKVLDGALGTHGGWLLEPYSDMPDSVGLNVTPVSDIRRSAQLAIENGFQMAIQGIGDRAVRELLNIYEEVFKANPDKKDPRWRIEHCQVIHPDDLPRFAQLGVIASIQGVFATSDGPWVVKRLGLERARERGYPFETLFQSGAVVVNGTDPPVEDIDPIANFYCSVTRKMADGTAFFPEQKMTRQQTLESYTVNAAYTGFEEDIKGSLAPGKLADITVFSKDLMTIPDEEIPSTEVLYTIIDGRIRYRKEGAGS